MPRKISDTVGDVHVTDPETGTVTVLHPGDTVPSKLDALVGEHVTSGTRPKAAAPAGPSQTPGVVEAGAAAQKAADEKSDDKAKADADALAAAEKAEAAKAAAAGKS